MNNLIKIILFFPLIGISQTYTVTQKPSYSPNTSTYEVKQKGTGAYENPKTYTPTTTSAQHIQNMQKDIVNSTSSAIQANSVRAAAQIQAAAQIRATQLAIENQNRIEKERKDEIKKQNLEKQRLEEENNPNSILNKFKNSKLKQENEDLKNKLLQMEMLLAKEKAEKENLEKIKSKKH